jgi:hypothetical protein
VISEASARTWPSLWPSLDDHTAERSHFLGVKIPLFFLGRTRGDRGEVPTGFTAWFRQPNSAVSQPFQRHTVGFKYVVSFCLLRRPSMADDYYSLIAHAVSRVPRNNDEVRHAIYEQARTALLEQLRAYRPPLSDAALANEHFALEAAISRVEEDLLLSVMRQFVGESRVSSWSKLSYISRAQEFVRSVVDKFE